MHGTINIQFVSGSIRQWITITVSHSDKRGAGKTLYINLFYKHLLWKTLPILLYLQPQIILWCGGRNSEMGFAAYSFTSRMVLHLVISSKQYLRPNISHISKVLASTDGSLWFKDTVVILRMMSTSLTFDKVKILWTWRMKDPLIF